MLSKREVEEIAERAQTDDDVPNIDHAEFRALVASLREAMEAADKAVQWWDDGDDVGDVDRDCFDPLRALLSLWNQVPSEACPNCGCAVSDHRHGGIGVCSGGHGCEDVRPSEEAK